MKCIRNPYHMLPASKVAAPRRIDDSSMDWATATNARLPYSNLPSNVRQHREELSAHTEHGYPRTNSWPVMAKARAKASHRVALLVTSSKLIPR